MLSPLKITDHLKIKPKSGGHAKEFCQPQCRARCKAALSRDDLIHPLERNADHCPTLKQRSLNRTIFESEIYGTLVFRVWDLAGGVGRIVPLGVLRAVNICTCHGVIDRLDLEVVRP